MLKVGVVSGISPLKELITKLLLPKTTKYNSMF
jgi:hypothetical protein